MGLRVVNVNLFCRQVDNVLRILVAEAPDYPAGRNSGYCVVKRVDDGRTLLAFEVGTDPPDKFERHSQLANEKADRLIQMYKSNGHKSSWYSRNEKEDKWGGAIICVIDGIQVAVSFSGLPEWADEALMLLAAASLNFIDRGDAGEIAMASQNKNFFRLATLPYFAQTV